MLSIEEVKKIADLARLELSEQELIKQTKVISSVLDYMNTLNEVDTSSVEPTSQVTGLENITREDEVEDCKYSDKLIELMPSLEYGKLKVPGVFSEN